MTTTYKFKAGYTKGGTATAPSSAPTIKIVDSDNNLLINGSATTALANLAGAYLYSYSGADNLDLIGLFTTSDTTVDQVDIFSYTPDILTTNLDAAMSDVPTDVWAAATRNTTGGTIGIVQGGTISGGTVAAVSGTVSANVKQINSTALTGNGSTTPWGPA